MNIYTGYSEKQIIVDSNNYLTLNLDIEDSKLPLVKAVTIPLTEKVDQWVEIGEDRAQAIISAKKVAGGEAQIVTEQFNQQVKLVSMTINNIQLTDEQALEVKGLYPNWEDYVGKQLNVGFKIQFNDNLYKVLQQHTVQEIYTPAATPSLYALVGANIEEGEHAGTKEDPIPYEQMMLIQKDKYYTQDGILYIGIIDAPNGYPNDLKDLHTLVQVVEQ